MTAFGRLVQSLNAQVDLPPGCSFLLDANKLSTLTLDGSNKVTAWADALGGPISFVTGPGGTGANPEYKASLFGGAGGVQFSGNKLLQSADALSNHGITYAGWTAMMVVQKTSSVTWFLASDGNGASIITAGIQNRQGESTFFTASQGFPLNVRVVQAGFCDGVRQYSAINGVIADNSTTGIGSAFGQAQLGGASGFNGSGPFDLQAFAMWPRKLSPNELVAARNYLQKRFSFSETRPAFNIVVDGNSLAWGQTSSNGWTMSDGIENSTWSGIHPNALDWKNYSIPGFSTTMLIARAATGIDTALDTTIAAGRRVLVMWEITNDLQLGQTDVQAYANVKAYCQARKTAGWQKIVLMTCLPRASVEAGRLSVNASIRANALSEGWADVIADVGADATIGPLSATSDLSLYSDGVHLTSAGHAIAAGILTTALNSIAV